MYYVYEPRKILKFFSQYIFNLSSNSVWLSSFNSLFSPSISLHFFFFCLRNLHAVVFHFQFLYKLSFSLKVFSTIVADLVGNNIVLSVTFQLSMTWKNVPVSYFVHSKVTSEGFVVVVFYLLLSEKYSKTFLVVKTYANLI